MLSLHGLVGGVANPLPLLRSGAGLSPTLDDQAVLLLVVLRTGLQPSQKSLKEFILLISHSSVHINPRLAPTVLARLSLSC